MEDVMDIAGLTRRRTSWSPVAFDVIRHGTASTCQNDPELLQIEVVDSRVLACQSSPRESTRSGRQARIPRGKEKMAGNAKPEQVNGDGQSLTSLSQSCYVAGTG